MFSSIRLAIVLIVLIVLSFVSNSSLFAQEVKQTRKIEGSDEYNQTMKDGQDAHQVNEFAQISWKDHKLGASIFALVTEGWGQIYGGPTYVVTDWMAVSGALGIESGHPSVRKAGTVWLGKNGVSFLTIQESGSDHWQKNLAKVEIKPGVAIGVLHQTYVGIGPYVEVSNGKATLWGSYALTDKRGIVGLKVGL